MALTLAVVEQAIENILTGGQAYTQSGLSLSRADLPQLIKLRDKLAFEAVRNTSTGSGVAFLDDFRDDTGDT